MFVKKTVDRARTWLLAAVLVLPVLLLIGLSAAASSVTR